MYYFSHKLLLIRCVGKIFMKPTNGITHFQHCVTILKWGIAKEKKKKEKKEKQIGLSFMKRIE